MQYAYIKYPAAMMCCLLKRHMISEHSYTSAAEHSQTRSCSVSWTVITWLFICWRCEDFRKFMESCGKQEKVNYLFVFCSERLFLGSTLPCRRTFEVVTEEKQGCLGFPAGCPNSPKVVATCMKEFVTSFATLQLATFTLLATSPVKYVCDHAGIPFGY